MGYTIPREKTPSQKIPGDKKSREIPDPGDINRPQKSQNPIPNWIFFWDFLPKMNNWGSPKNPIPKPPLDVNSYLYPLDVLTLKFPIIMSDTFAVRMNYFRIDFC